MCIINGSISTWQLSVHIDIFIVYVFYFSLQIFLGSRGGGKTNIFIPPVKKITMY